MKISLLIFQTEQVKWTEWSKRLKVASWKNQSTKLLLMFSKNWILKAKTTKQLLKSVKIESWTAKSTKQLLKSLKIESSKEVPNNSFKSVKIESWKAQNK